MQIGSVLFASILFPLTILSLVIEPSSINLNSLNITLLYQSQPSNQTNPYRVVCSVIPRRQDLPNFHEDSCVTAIPIACAKLTTFAPEYLLRDKWIWTNLPGCSLAYFVPMAADSRSIPTKQDCEANIYGYMVETCVPSNWINLGTINVASPPTPSGAGRAWLQDYPRFLISPKELDTVAPSL